MLLSKFKSTYNINEFIIKKNSFLKMDKSKLIKKLQPTVDKAKAKATSWYQGTTHNKYIAYTLGALFLLILGKSVLIPGGTSWTKAQKNEVFNACSQYSAPGEEKKQARYCKCNLKKVEKIVSYGEYKYYGAIGAAAQTDRSKMDKELKALNKVMDVCFAKHLK